MKIDRKKLLKLYMRRVKKICNQCDWVTEFGPEEIVEMICDIIETENVEEKDNPKCPDCQQYLP